MTDSSAMPIDVASAAVAGAFAPRLRRDLVGDHDVRRNDVTSAGIERSPPSVAEPASADRTSLLMAARTPLPHKLSTDQQRQQAAGDRLQHHGGQEQERPAGHPTSPLPRLRRDGRQHQRGDDAQRHGPVRGEGVHAEENGCPSRKATSSRNSPPGARWRRTGRLDPEDVRKRTPAGSPLWRTCVRARAGRPAPVAQRS